MFFPQLLNKLLFFYYYFYFFKWKIGIQDTPIQDVRQYTSDCIDKDKNAISARHKYLTDNINNNNSLKARAYLMNVFENLQQNQSRVTLECASTVCQIPSLITGTVSQEDFPIHFLQFSEASLSAVVNVRHTLLLSQTGNINGGSLICQVCQDDHLAHE